jgi:hypothetical protein
MPSSVTSNRELRQGRWLKRIEKLVPGMIQQAEKEGGTVSAQLGKKCLSDGRVVKFTLEARIEHQDTGGAHKRR